MNQQQRKTVTIMETAIGKILTFGASRKMTVISESVINNNNGYSIVQLVGVKGGVNQAIRRHNNTYRIL